MLKSKFMTGCMLFALALLSFQAAWAGTSTGDPNGVGGLNGFGGLTPGNALPGPGLVGLIAAGVIISIAVSRSRK